MGDSLKDETRQFTIVYLIYDADVLGTGIEQLAPENHLPGGYELPKRLAMEAVAAKFTQTEGDSEWGFDYLAREGSGDQYLSAADMPDDYEGDGYQGHHRKWVAELTRAEWELFAESYLIELDERGFPAEYEDTLGSLTEYGLLAAVSVDNREGWGTSYGGTVIDSSIYVSFGDDGDDSELDAP